MGRARTPPSSAPASWAPASSSASLLLQPQMLSYQTPSLKPTQGRRPGNLSSESCRWPCLPSAFPSLQSGLHPLCTRCPTPRGRSPRKRWSSREDDRAQPGSTRGGHQRSRRRPRRSLPPHTPPVPTSGSGSAGWKALCPWSGTRFLGCLSVPAPPRGPLGPGR